MSYLIFPPSTSSGTEVENGFNKSAENISSDGMVSGLAWGENVGWINLSGGASASPPQPVFMQCDGRLTGYAWSENIGWINLSSAESGKFVAIDSEQAPYACDMNHDGSSDGRDVSPFVDLLLHNGGTWTDVCSGDIEPSPDGLINLDDVPAFIDCLLM